MHDGLYVTGDEVMFCTRALNRPKCSFKVVSDSLQTFMSESGFEPRIFSLVTNTLTTRQAGGLYNTRIHTNRKNYF